MRDEKYKCGNEKYKLGTGEIYTQFTTKVYDQLKNPWLRRIFNDMATKRRLETVKANIPRKVQANNPIKVFSIMQSRKIALGRLYVR